MIGAPAGLALLRYWREGIAVLAIMGILAMTSLWIDARGDAKREALRFNQAQAEIAQLRTQNVALERAAQERAADTTAVQTMEKRYETVIREAPAGRPGAASVRLGCQRLREARVPADRLPRECR